MGLPSFGDTASRQIRLQRAINAGVVEIMVPAVVPADARELGPLLDACSAQTRGLCLYYGLGIHPYALAELEASGDAERLTALEEALSSSRDARLLAVGECGLDFRRARARLVDRVRQVDVTRGQLDLARKLGRPAILHCVAAHPTLLELMDERPLPPSVLHSFSGSAEIAREYVKRGHYVSFSTSLLHSDARKVAEAAASVPADRLLVETDSPDQTPSTLRPAINEPANVVLVANRLAELRSRPLDVVAASTRENARRVFGIGDPA